MYMHGFLWKGEYGGGGVGVEEYLTCGLGVRLYKSNQYLIFVYGRSV